MTPAARSAVLNEAGLSSYFERIRDYPMLEVGEERLLAKRWREKGDSAAAHKLITSHLRLVVKIAMRYRGYGLPISETVSEGSIGLVQAVKRFEPDRGFRLATYAIWWIRLRFKSMSCAPGRWFGSGRPRIKRRCSSVYARQGLVSLPSETLTSASIRSGRSQRG